MTKGGGGKADQTGNKQPFAAFRIGCFSYLQADKINQDGGCNQQNEVFDFPVPVKEVTGGKQKRPTEPVRNNKITGKPGGKKNKNSSELNIILSFFYV